MSSLPFANSWIVLGAGVVLWHIGHTMCGQALLKAAKPSRGVRMLSWLGIIGVCLGLFAGFRGPMRLGPITLRPFSFAHFIDKRRAEALAYAHANLKVSRRAAHGWSKSSKKALEYSVQNNGNRSISSLMLRFNNERGKGKATIDLKLNGPFPVRRTTTKVISLPQTVRRSYFKPVSRVDGTHIVGARF